MPITQQEKTYLKNKHRGGQNNSKGAIYESYYATYKIASFINQHITQLENVLLTSQVTDTFVDDLLIKEPGSHLIYHQLKDVKNLTWETGKLKYDFTRQMEISSEKHELFDLNLIYSDQNCSVCVIPPEFCQYTTATYFPACSSINQLIISYPPFKEAIQNITVLPNAEDDVLSGIATAILGTWNSIEQKNVSLQQISDLIRLNGQGYVNIKTYPTIEVSERCKAILTRFGLDFYENGLNLYWSYQHMKGEVLWTKEKEHELQESNPSNLWDLIEILS